MYGCHVVIFNISSYIKQPKTSECNVAMRTGRDFLHLNQVRITALTSFSIISSNLNERTFVQIDIQQWEDHLLELKRDHFSFRKFQQVSKSLGIQSYSQIMMAVLNHLLSITCRCYYPSRKAIGSLGASSNLSIWLQLPDFNEVLQAGIFVLLMWDHHPIFKISFESPVKKKLVRSQIFPMIEPQFDSIFLEKHFKKQNI